MSYVEERELESAYLMQTYARKPVELVSGRGMEVVDDAGRTYLDFVSGVGAVSLGHCHPTLVAALEEQARTLVHVSNYYYIEHRGEVARAVSDLLNACVPEAERAPWRSFFANSGAEANECAFKLARLHAKKRAAARAEAEGADETAVAAAREAAPRIIVTLDASFHGRTLATLAATAQPAKQEAFRPLPDGFARTPINDVAALEALFEAQGDAICAVMVECVQGESGVHPCTAEFLQTARRLTEERGALLMCDEIQCGMGRTGTMFAWQDYGVKPDIMAMAKAIGGGVPVGAFAMTEKVAEKSLAPGDHGTTYGGNPFVCAAVSKVLDIYEEEHILEHVKKVSAYLEKKLDALAAKSDAVKERRGKGLMQGLAMNVPVGEVIAKAQEEGLLVISAGGNVLRIVPPLIITEDHVDEMIEKLKKAL